MKKICIIEDDQKVQKIYQEALTKAGYQAIAYSDAKTGLMALHNETPDLLLLDIMLPEGMNGFDVLEEMKRDDKLKNVPVIVLTNLDSERKVAEEIGANDYLVKAETTIDQILTKVASLVG